jgi:hypothetical protein
LRLKLPQPYCHNHTATTIREGARECAACFDASVVQSHSAAPQPGNDLPCISTGLCSLSSRASCSRCRAVVVAVNAWIGTCSPADARDAAVRLYVLFDAVCCTVSRSVTRHMPSRLYDAWLSGPFEYARVP